MPEHKRKPALDEFDQEPGRAYADFLIVVCVAVLADALSVAFDAREHLNYLLISWEIWELDEFFVALPVWALALAWFSYRRWKESYRELAMRHRAEAAARLKHQQLMQADKMASLGVLVSGMAHEINNPNHFIMSHVSPLMSAWEGATPILERYYEENGDFSIAGMDYSEARTQIPTMLTGILEGSNRIKTIVDELRNFAREYPAGLAEPVELNSVARSAITLLSDMLKKSTKHFSVDYGSGIPSVEGSYQRLEQVAVNLIQNACQALEHDDRGISVATYYDVDRGEAVLEVRDEGTGIAEDILGQITDPFFTTRREAGGTGLGLSISSSIVMDHGGTLSFSSRPGEGTTAKVTLPVTAVDAAADGAGQDR